MSIILTHIGRTPTQPQFSLDIFTEHYKANETADIVLTDSSVPQKGDAHPSYAFMFVTDRHCIETGERASALDLVYTGCLKDDGEGNPVLPPAQHKYSNAVQTAQSGLGISGQVATSPFTLQFYAQTSELDFWSYNGIGALDTAPEPVADPIIIALTVGDASFSPLDTGIAIIIATFFQLRVTDTIEPQEIVAGKFWKNLERKTLYYGAPIFVAEIYADVNVIAIWNPGRDYTVSDSLTLTGGGGSATIVVSTLGARDSITGFTISADTITSTDPVILTASGGSGSGAQFVCVKLP